MDKPARELFAQMVAQGVPVKDAYTRAGFKGADAARAQLRYDPHVDARVKWLLADRVRADNEARHKGEAKIKDARLRLVREFERVAYSAIGDVMSWDRKPVVGQDGSVDGFQDEIVAQPSARLARGTMAAIKSVRTKGGVLQVEMHDKINAMNSLAKVLGMTVDAAPVAPSVTVNQINVGDVQAVEAARRIAFVLGLAGASAPQPKTIEHEPAKPTPKG